MQRHYYYSCSVTACLNTSRNSTYSFFRLPCEIEKRNLWLRLIGRENVRNAWSSFLRVCEVHFDPNSLYRSTNRAILKKDAIPKFLLPINRRGDKVFQTSAATTEAYTQHETVQCDSYSQTAPHIFTICHPKRKLETDSTEKSKKRLKSKVAPETNIDVFQKLCDKLLSENLSKVVKEQAKFNLKPFRNEYSTDYKMFCLNLYYTSPQAYNFLSESLLNMPSKTTLKRMYMQINTKVNSHIMDVLKTKVSSMTDMDRNCSLVIYSTSLKANLFYNIKEDKIYGFHEIDGKQSSEPAKYALVAIIHGFFLNYNQPVGFALLSDCKDYKNILKWIDKLIKKLFVIGLKIRVLNMGSNFRNSAKERKVTIETPYFFVDSHKIFYIFDALDLMKSVRNNLMKYNFNFDSSVAKWEHIVKLYEKDKTRPERIGPKLTQSHITPNHFERNEVKLAVQVLSATVAESLSKYKDVGAIDPTAEGTIKLVQIMNNLLDFLNSSIPFSSIEYQKAFNGTTLQISFINEMMKFFETLRLINPKTGKDATSKVKFLKGFQITLKSILLLFEDLKSEGYSHIMTRRLNRDCSEKLICNSTEPTSWQFVSAFRKKFYISLIKRPKQDNCSNDLSDILLEGNNLYASLASDEKPSTSAEQPANVAEILKQGNTNDNPLVSSADYKKFDLSEKNGILHLCGYLFKKCFDQHKDCSLLQSYLRSVNLSQDATFIPFEDCSKDGGSTSLIIPQDNFVEFVEAMENKFKSFCKYKKMECKVLKSILEEFQYISFSMPCPCFPILYLKKLFLRLRIFHTLKYNNRAFKRCGNRQKLFSINNL